MARRNLPAISPASSRSRLVLKLEWSQTGSSPPELHSLHQLALRANAVKRLQEHRPEQPFRRNQRPAKPVRVKLRKIIIQRRQRRIGNVADPPKRMVRTYPRFNIDVGKQRSRAFIRPAHPALPSFRESESQSG